MVHFLRLLKALFLWMILKLSFIPTLQTRTWKQRCKLSHVICIFSKWQRWTEGQSSGSELHVHLWPPCLTPPQFVQSLSLVWGCTRNIEPLDFFFFLMSFQSRRAVDLVQYLFNFNPWLVCTLVIQGRKPTFLCTKFSSDANCWIWIHFEDVTMLWSLVLKSCEPLWQVHLWKLVSEFLCVEKKKGCLYVLLFSITCWHCTNSLEVWKSKCWLRS